MKQFISLLCLTVVILATQPSYAQSQMEMNVQAYKQFEGADKELNKTYQLILKQHSDDPVFLEKFKAAEKAWIAYRDAMVEAQFPIDKPENLKIEYGSIYPVCEANVKRRLTEEHIRELKQWLKPFEEGDVCSGKRGLNLTN